MGNPRGLQPLTGTFSEVTLVTALGQVAQIGEGFGLLGLQVGEEEDHLDDDPLPLEPIPVLVENAALLPHRGRLEDRLGGESFVPVGVVDAR